MEKVVTLNINSQFKKLYNKGRSSVRSSVVIYTKRNGLSYNRIGITVGKKIGKAVVRNRAKRRLRALYRLNMDRLKTGYDFVLVARGRTAGVAFKKLAEDFSAALYELDVMNNADVK